MRLKWINERKKAILDELSMDAIGTSSANSVKSDHGCTLRIYFVNADDNVALTLYNVTLTLYNVTLT